MPYVLTEQQCADMQDGLARAIDHLKMVASAVPLRAQHRLTIIQREIEQVQQMLPTNYLPGAPSHLLAALLSSSNERCPSDIPLYSALKTMLARRGYGMFVQGVTLHEEDGPPVSVEMCYALRPPLRPGGQERCIGLSLTLKALSTMTADSFFQEMAARIDDACARGQHHRRCQCGEPLLVKEKRGTTDYRRVCDGPRGPRLTQCPRCQVALTEQVVHEIDDVSEEVAVCPQLL